MIKSLMFKINKPVKRIFLLFFILFTLVISLAFDKRKLIDKIKVEKYRVNESSFFIIYNNNLILQSAGFVVKKGAKEENREIYGINHVWEHLFFRNKINGKSIKDILNDCQYNATTHNDYISFYAVGDYEKILRTFIYALNYPNFNNEDLELEKKIVITELSMRNFEINPFKIYTNPTGGTIQTVNNISFQKMLSFMKNVEKKNVIYFVILNNQDKVDLNKFFDNVEIDYSLSISLEPKLGDQDSKNIYDDFLAFVSTFDLYLDKNNNNLLLYNSYTNFTNREIFYLDLISFYFSNDFFEKNRKKLLSYGINNMESYMYPQREELTITILLSLEGKEYSDKEKKLTKREQEIKDLLLSELKNINYDSFYRSYMGLYNDLLRNFSDSWNFTQIIPFFVYSENWDLLNYYVRGCEN